MFTLLLISSITLAIALLVMTLATLLAKKTLGDREKASPYECGFDPKNSARMPFSLRFFLIAVIFLIFDVEITLLLPIVSSLNFTNIFSWSLTSLIFLFILLLGLYYEWSQDALEWS
uniref:NADH dehydrogenase subunit 3 n=1 Tax=Opecarcinus hypostegus TaxID=1903098 RepID=UPI0028D4D6E9|nr:NADH dehydrogenase subunit 3 [Opecarcinus hypostegus]WMY25245.1 NADH dehydrogenase subunit 3 [Opecarcinus hypostegus]